MAFFDVAGRGVLAGDHGGLEPREDRGVHFEVSGAGFGRQPVGVGDADGLAALAFGEGAQTDPVGQVRLQAPQVLGLEPLGGQEQVDADGAADAADGDEQLGEVGLGRQQLGELVDDDQQVRHRFELGVGLAQFGVGVDVGQVPGVLEELLAAGHLAVEGLGEAVDEVEVVGEVGDGPGAVGQGVAVGEGRPALEVDGEQREALGRVADGEGGDEGAEGLGLARAGGADDEPVRAHAAERGLLEVELDDPAVGVDGEGHAQQLGLPARGPGPRRVDGGGVVDAEDVGQAVDAGEGVGGVVGVQPPRAEGARDRGEDGRVDRVGAAAESGLADVAFGAVDAGDGEPLAFDGEAGRGVLGLLALLGHEGADVDAEEGGVDAGDEAGQGDLVLAVDEDEEVPGAGAGRGAAAAAQFAGADGEVLGEQFGQFGGGGAQQRHRQVQSGAVEEQVRQPGRRGPVPGRVGGGDDGDLEVFGRHEDGQLREEGLGGGAGLGVVADDRQLADLADGDGQGLSGEGGVAFDQFFGAAVAHRVVDGQGVGVDLERQAAAERGLGQAAADGQQVGVGGAALPAPRRVAGDAEQQAGVRVAGGAPVALGAHGFADGVPGVLEVVEVAFAFLAELAAGPRAHGDEQDDAHGDAGDEHEQPGRGVEGSLQIGQDHDHGARA